MIDCQKPERQGVASPEIGGTTQLTPDTGLQHLPQLNRSLNSQKLSKLSITNTILLSPYHSARAISHIRTIRLAHTLCVFGVGKLGRVVLVMSCPPSV